MPEILGGPSYGLRLEDGLNAEAAEKNPAIPAGSPEVAPDSVEPLAGLSPETSPDDEFFPHFFTQLNLARARQDMLDPRGERKLEERGTPEEYELLEQALTTINRQALENLTQYR